MVVAKIKLQLKECLEDQKYDSNLNQLDTIWGSSLNLQFRQPDKNIFSPEDWQIRGKNKEEFQDWISNHMAHSLFFDGAAKGNPGKAGARGTVNNTEGTLIHSYA